eukprot:8919259-Pyramimonas_sp.AAC.1
MAFGGIGRVVVGRAGVAARNDGVSMGLSGDGGHHLECAITCAGAAYPMNGVRSRMTSRMRHEVREV